MKADSDPHAAAPRRRRWMRWALGLSLALNLAVLGLVAGAALRHGGPDRGGHPKPMGVMLYRELPREIRRELRETAFAPRAEIDRQRRADAAAVDAALRAQPFDPARLEAVLQAQAAQRAAHHARMQAAWLDRVAAMSDAERAAYADRLQAALARQDKIGKTGKMGGKAGRDRGDE